MKKYIGWVLYFAVFSILIYHCEMHFRESGSSVWAENCCGPYGCTIQVENHLGMELPGVRVRLYQEKRGDTVMYFQEVPFAQKDEGQARRVSETDTDDTGLIHLYDYRKAHIFWKKCMCRQGMKF